MYIHPLFWLISSLVFILFELGHPGLFYFLSFSCGAFVSLIANLADLSEFDQIVLFFLASIVATVALRKWVRRYGNRGHFYSNMYALRGKKGVVVTPSVKGQFAGYIHIEGQVWAYTTIDDEVIQAGSSVEVIDVRGAHLVVKSIS